MGATSATILGREHYIGSPEPHAIVATACDSCMMPVIAFVDSASTIITYYPKHVPQARFPDVPEPIAKDAAEAARCFSVEAWRATVAMARRAVQASALQLKAPKDRKLRAQIDWLGEQGKVTQPLIEMAHEIRLTGTTARTRTRTG